MDIQWANILAGADGQVQTVRDVSGPANGEYERRPVEREI